MAAWLWLWLKPYITGPVPAATLTTFSQAASRWLPPAHVATYWSMPQLTPGRLLLCVVRSSRKGPPLLHLRRFRRSCLGRPSHQGPACVSTRVRSHIIRAPHARRAHAGASAAIWMADAILITAASPSGWCRAAGEVAGGAYVVSGTVCIPDVYRDPTV